LIVEQIRVGPMQNFQYLLMDEESREAMAIDSGWETLPIVEAARRAGMKVKYVVATHGHFDHSETLRALATELGDASVVVHESSEVDHDLEVRGNDVLKLGNAGVKVLHTPGHTVDSICLFDGADLFTGDTLFIGNCGRTDLPGGSAKALYESLHGVIMALPRETTIYPGHDYGEVPSRSLGEEVKRNPTLLAKNLEEFIGLP
jgi:hydroxyacylglutathione hydrolase